MQYNESLYRKVKTPVLFQMEAMECGAAALGIILAYYRKFIPLERLRIDCGVTRNGSKASYILEAAKKYGLDAEALKYDIDELHQVKIPFIVFWNFNHFVVVEGFCRTWVYINDPASGSRKISYQEFSDSFTGVVLSFSPGADFKREGHKPGILQSLKRRTTNAGAPLLFVLFTGLALILPGIVIPVFTKVFIDGFLVDGIHTLIAPLITGILITALLRGWLTWIQRQCLLKLETKLSVSESSRFFWKMLSLPVEFYEQRSAGDISYRMSLNDKIAQLISKQLSVNILDAILAVFYLVILFRYSIVLTVIVIFITAFNIVVLKIIARKRVEGNTKLLQDRGKLMGTSLSGLRYIETLKASGAESDFFARWSGYMTNVINSEQSLNYYTQFLLVLPSFLSSLNNLVILVLGCIFIIEGRISIGSLVAYQSLVSFFVTPINNLVNLGSSIQEIEGDLNRIDDVFNYKEKISETGSFGSSDDDINAEIRKLDGAVELKNITFGYDLLGHPLIEGFNLSVKPGARIAVIGPSGSGKSTLSKIIAGLYQPWTGKVLFDGAETSAINSRIIKNSISMVDQNIMLFEGTIRENLTLWNTVVEEGCIVQAAKDAEIYDDIHKREAGFDSVVEEGGKNFSGGQCQRLEIARALVSNPRIIILDEATSALDPLTELRIDENLRRRGCTCIIIANRLSTIRDCDEIIVLSHGNVVERGTHEELILREGPYRDLIQLM